MEFLKKNKSHRSLFFHLVVVLTGITILINVTVFAFFRLSGPPVKFQLMTHLERYSGYLVKELGQPPQKENALKLAKELNLEISYTGMGNSWQTSENIPPLEELKEDLKTRLSHMKKPVNGSALVGHYSGGLYKIYPVSGGAVVFWLEGHDWIARSTRQIFGLLIFFSLVFFLAGWVLRRMLLPVRIMEKSFSEVSRGNFETRMDLSGPREFLSAAKGFNSMVKQISEMIANRERLLRDMSHEFRSPLARIKLALGMMSESDEKKSIEEDILEMENLVTDILEAYKYAENHKSGSALIFKKSWEVFNLRDLVTFQVEKIRRTYNNTSFIEIQNQEKIYINGEKEKIKSLLGNLLENAVKHNPPGGNVTINLKQGIELNKAILEVSDEGKGVSEDLRDKIFDPFYRIEESRTRGSGYGLGLFLCREIALAHGGDISASANIPKGTVFTVKIPLANTP